LSRLTDADLGNSSIKTTDAGLGLSEEFRALDRRWSSLVRARDDKVREMAEQHKFQGVRVLH
jgi:hypothetical protein